MRCARPTAMAPPSRASGYRAGATGDRNEVSQPHRTRHRIGAQDRHAARSLSDGGRQPYPHLTQRRVASRARSPANIRELRIIAKSKRQTVKRMRSEVMDMMHADIRGKPAQDGG